MSRSHHPTSLAMSRSAAQQIKLSGKSPLEICSTFERKRRRKTRISTCSPRIFCLGAQGSHFEVLIPLHGGMTTPCYGTMNHALNFDHDIILRRQPLVGTWYHHQSLKKIRFEIHHSNYHRSPTQAKAPSPSCTNPSVPPTSEAVCPSRSKGTQAAVPALADATVAPLTGFLISRAALDSGTQEQKSWIRFPSLTHNSQSCKSKGRKLDQLTSK